ncbi:MAG TPA: molybdopterin cofactor-binding domain-containing protein, partial [Vicinamibacterales bacterium]
MKSPSIPSDSSTPSDPSIFPERYELSEPRRYVFELERRDFIRLFGAGIVVAVAATDVLAQESGRVRPQGRGETPDLAAWIHIDDHGRAFVNTGKVEIGQNIRTSLSQTVADELRVPMASVTLVMADTDKTPFDQGTFGSMTTPRMAPVLAKAAATAREMLIDLAAQRWRADRSALTARDGKIVARDGRTLSYAELTKDQALTG